jgi:hypothetical protein
MKNKPKTLVDRLRQRAAPLYISLFIYQIDGIWLSNCSNNAYVLNSEASERGIYNDQTAPASCHTNN